MSKSKMIARQFVMSASLHKALKRHAIKCDVTMSEIVSNFVKYFLIHQAKK